MLNCILTFYFYLLLFISLPCIPGTFNNELKQTSCKDCLANTFTNQTLQTVCKDCSTGEKSEGGSASCQRCGAGEAGTPCTKCLAGEYRAGSDTDATTCDSCPKGYYQSEIGQGSCLPCIPSTYNDQVKRTSCTSCLAKFYTDQTLQLKCKSCPNGKTSEAGSAACSSCGAGQAGATCDDCIAGKFRSGSDTQAAICKDCPHGFYQGDTQQGSCLPCIPGEFNDVTGAKICKSCLANTFSASTEKMICENCAEGKTSLAGSAGCVPCAAGRKLNLFLGSKNTIAAIDTCVLNLFFFSFFLYMFFLLFFLPFVDNVNNSPPTVRSNSLPEKKQELHVTIVFKESFVLVLTRKLKSVTIVQKDTTKVTRDKLVVFLAFPVNIQVWTVIPNVFLVIKIRLMKNQHKPHVYCVPLEEHLKQVPPVVLPVPLANTSILQELVCNVQLVGTQQKVMLWNVFNVE